MICFVCFPLFTYLHFPCYFFFFIVVLQKVIETCSAGKNIVDICEYGDKLIIEEVNFFMMLS